MYTCLGIMALLLLLQVNEMNPPGLLKVAIEPLLLCKAAGSINQLLIR
jgi:hypothetical protein